MNHPPVLDHLFRHQFGKMVSIFSRIFGLQHLTLIEDAIQDTFISALNQWKHQPPDNPEAWLNRAARNRIIDLLRKLSAEDQRIDNITSGIGTLPIQELFLENEVEDNLLRMIFTACHPSLQQQDQVAFALKVVSGFDHKEIASALLLKEETVKKRLTRARKSIQKQNIRFEIPEGRELTKRLPSVMEVIYLIFNEGFYSIKQTGLIREELCGEALRLTQLLMKKAVTTTPEVHALYAVLCFQAARLKSRVTPEGELIRLQEQDRTLWYFPLIQLGHEAMAIAVQTDHFSTYHYQAAILAEHLKASNYEETDWHKVLLWQEQLATLEPTATHFLNLAIVYLELGRLKKAEDTLSRITPPSLEQRLYLYHATLAEFHFRNKNKEAALASIDKAIGSVHNATEKKFLIKKRKAFLSY